MLRVSTFGGCVRKVRWVERGEERRNAPKWKASFRKGVRGSVVVDGSGGRRSSRVEERPFPASNARSRSGVYRAQVRSGLARPSFAETVAQPRVSFVSDVECGSPGGVLARQTGSKEGFPVVSFSAHQIQAGLEKFRFALVMKFSSKRPPATELQHLISSRWGVHGRFSYSEIWDAVHVLINLESEADVQKGLSCKTRKVGVCQFKLFRWFPKYDPLKSSSPSRQWIRLPGIPLFLYDKAFAKSIVSSFAKFLKLDTDSELGRNFSCMRLCVVLKDGANMPEKVWIQLPDNRSYWQSIEVDSPQNSLCRADGSNSVAECVNKGGESDSANEILAEEHIQRHMVDERLGEDGIFGSVLFPDCVEERNGNPIESDSPVGGLGAVPDFVISTGGEFNSLSQADNNSSVIGNVDHVPNEAVHQVICSSPVRGLAGDAGKDMDLGVDCSAALRNKDKEWQTVSYGRKKRSGSRKEAKFSGLPSPRMGSIDSVTAVGGHVGSNKVIVPAGANSIDMSSAAFLNEKEPTADSIGSRPTNQVICSHPNFSTAVPSCEISSGSLVSPVGQSKVVPCDSLELLRKKSGRHKLAYAREGHNDQVSIAPLSLPEDKIASYGNDIICYDEEFVPLDARALYLRLKAEHSDDADIFQVMDHVMDQMYKAASGAQNDNLGEDSDGFIDLSRILKHPRQKSKGSRSSGRSCPKKKGSNVVY